MTRHLADIAPCMVPKSGHVTITKIENLHIHTRRKFTDSKSVILFDLRRKPFQNSGVTRHFQGQKVKGQGHRGGGILWRPPAQLVITAHI